MQTSSPPPHGLSAGQCVVAAITSAATMLRRRLLLVLVVSIVTQGLYVWVVLPLLLTLFQTALRAAGVDGLSLAGLPGLVSSPLAMLALVLLALVATVFAVIEISIFSVVAHLCLRGKEPGIGAILRGVRQLARRVASWQILLVAAYALLVLPLSHLGVGASLTSHIAIPTFISGELAKTPVGAWAYGLVVLGLLYLALRLAATAAALAGDEVSVLAAMRRSVALTRRTQVHVAGVFLAIGVAAATVYLLAALLGAIPVAIASGSDAGDGVAGSMLALLDLVRFVTTGFAAAFLSFFFVSLDRGVSRRGGADARERVPRPVRDIPSRVVAVSALVLFGILAAPPVVFATIASGDAASEPLIIAHRGYTAVGVENTISSLQGAAAAGADMVEMDIQETADQGYVVIHDVSLQRLAGDGRSVYDLTEAQASQVTVRQGEFEERIPTLAEYLRTADDLGIRVLVEVKPHGHEAPGFVSRVVTVMNGLDPDHRHMIQSLDAGIVDGIAAADPDREVALVTGFQIGDAPRTEAGTVAVEDWSYSDEMLVGLHDQGRRLFVWTVDDTGVMGEYLDRGVDGIITDRVAEAVTLRDLHQRITNPVSRYLDAANRTIRPW